MWISPGFESRGATHPGTGEGRMSNAEYLIKREQEELEAALRSTDRRVRDRHLELADAYTFLLSEMKRQEQHPERVEQS